MQCTLKFQLAFGFQGVCVSGLFCFMFCWLIVFNVLCFVFTTVGSEVDTNFMMTSIGFVV